MNMGIRVVPKRNERLPITLKRFRKLCEKEGIQKEITKHAFYEKPSEKRRRNKRKAQSRARHLEADN